MNAQGVKNEAHVQELLDDPDYIAQEKLDGIRAIVHITATGLRLFSRSAGTADPTRPLEKTSSLPHLACIVFPRLVGTILDAEILIPGIDCAGIAGKINGASTTGETKHARLFVFDILRVCDTDLLSHKLVRRLAILTMLTPRLRNPNICVLPVAMGNEDKQALYTSVSKSGGEGIMFKNLEAFYIPGARPSGNWYKAKKSATFDCVIMGFTKGTGKYKERIGAVRFGQYVRGALRELGQASGMTDQIRKDMSEYPNSFIGKVVRSGGWSALSPAPYATHNTQESTWRKDPPNAFGTMENNRLIAR
jgi:ATP-dependent DNA ligase